jgi:hypothetical protein
MNKFWVSTGSLLIVGIAAILFMNSTSSVNFTDLETECVYDRGEEVNVELTQSNRLNIDGYFPLNHTEAEMRYKYSERGNRIVINIYGAKDRPVESFLRECNAVGVYKGTTKAYEGMKWVTVKHQGDQVYKTRIDFN